MDNLKTCIMYQDYGPLKLHEGDVVSVKTDVNGSVVVGPQLNEFTPGRVFVKTGESSYKLVPSDYINIQD